MGKVSEQSKVSWRYILFVDGDDNVFFAENIDLRGPFAHAVVAFFDTVVVIELLILQCCIAGSTYFRLFSFL